MKATSSSTHQASWIVINGQTYRLWRILKVILYIPLGGRKTWNGRTKRSLSLEVEAAEFRFCRQCNRKQRGSIIGSAPRPGSQLHLVWSSYLFALLHFWRKAIHYQQPSNLPDQMGWISNVSLDFVCDTGRVKWFDPVVTPIRYRGTEEALSRRSETCIEIQEIDGIGAKSTLQIHCSGYTRAEGIFRGGW